MSANFVDLGLEISKDSFCNLGSKDYLNEILDNKSKVNQFEKLTFEWLSKEDEHDLMNFLKTKLNFKKEFTPSDKDETIKLNILQWFSIYNILIEYKGLDDVKHLYSLFKDKFDLLIGEEPLEKNLIKSLTTEVIYKTDKYQKLTNLNRFLIILICIFNLLYFISSYSFLNYFMAAIGLIVISVILYKVHYAKIEKKKVYLDVYTQMLLDHSY
jgi:hypothetical protein